VATPPEAGLTGAGSDGAVVSTTAPNDDRILTIPNALSLLRLAGVPVFLWLLLGPHADGLALVILMLSGFTDWLDGVLARRLHQYSRLGALLDPAADRLYILATLIGLLLRGVIPLWLVILIVGRDLAITVAVAMLRPLGWGPPEVNYLGKAATFCLLYAFPLLLLGASNGTPSQIAKPIAWAFTIWGTALYLWAGVLYVNQCRQVRRGGPPP
jgi:cardiolipin synthase